MFYGAWHGSEVSRFGFVPPRMARYHLNLALAYGGGRYLSPLWNK